MTDQSNAPGKPAAIKTLNGRPAPGKPGPLATPGNLPRGIAGTREAQEMFPGALANQAAYIAKQVEIADKTTALAAAQRSYNDALTFTADKWDIIAGKVQTAGQGMADAFGDAGRGIGDMASIYATYQADRTRAEADHLARIKEAGTDQAQIARENARFALRSSGAQVAAFGDAAAAAKGFFKEGSSGYKALEIAEKTFRAIQFALSLRAMAQDAIETGTKLATGAARIAVGATEAVVNAIKSLPFPLNIAAGAATIAALAGIGVSVAGSFGGGKNTLPTSNTGTGTVLGDTSAKSDSIKNSIDALKEVDTLTNGSILGGGFDASYYSDVEKKKKLFGLTTSTKYSTQYGAADAGLENQFTLILKSFNDAIAAAAGPLGVATGDVQARLNGFIVNIGKIGLKGLTGEQIEEKLSAVFGAAADGMAAAAFPGLEQFQKVGEGVFETLVRVASTVEAVGTSLSLLGTNTQTMGIGVKLALADQFDSVSALTDAASAYFQTFYSKEEQAAAKTAQMTGVFASLGVAMPSTLAGFRQLVEAQDLTTAAGQSTYATLLKLAPAFAELQASLEGAKCAADIASERQDLQRQLLELAGDTAAIRALDLAKLDPSNRALQEQIYAVQDAQTAAAAAKTLADAWTSVGDSITTEIERIRGLTGTNTGGGFAQLLGQFNAANMAARGGDQEAAKSLPGLSQALLTAAAASATSRQELDRVQAQTAAALEATNAAIKGIAGVASPSTPTGKSNITFLDTAAMTQAAQASPSAANDDLLEEVKSLREEIVQMRADNNTGHATTAGNTAKIARKFEDVTAASGGEAISVASAA